MLMLFAASQKEKNSERDKNLGKSSWGYKYHKFTGCGSRPSGKKLSIYYYILNSKFASLNLRLSTHSVIIILYVSYTCCSVFVSIYLFSFIH